MNADNAKAALKAAAYALVALIGWSKTVKYLQEVANDIDNDAWHAGR